MAAGSRGYLAASGVTNSRARAVLREHSPRRVPTGDSKLHVGELRRLKTPLETALVVHCVAARNDLTSPVFLVWCLTVLATGARTQPTRRRQPCTTCASFEGKLYLYGRRCQDLVRFFALLRIKPPRAGPPVVPSGFQPCGRTPRRGSLDALAAALGPITRRLRGLPGYLILFAPRSSQRQLQTESLSPVFLRYIYYTAHIDSTLPFCIKLNSSQSVYSL